MFDSREVFTGSAGTQPGDVGPRWYPFWSAFIVAAASAVVAYQSLTMPQPKEGVFSGTGSVAAVLRLIIPMIVYTISFAWLGFYLSTGLFMAFFAQFIGKYKPYWSLASGIITPLAIYLLFEVGFRLLLPKSVFYPGIPF
jgi:hypothetical protein